MKPTIEQVDAAMDVLKNAPVAFSKDESVFCFEPSQYKTALFALRFLRLAMQPPTADMLKAGQPCFDQQQDASGFEAIRDKLLEKAAQ